MSPSSDLQAAIKALLDADGTLPAKVPVLARVPKDLGNDIDAATAFQGGLCILLPPALPISAPSMQGGDLVFFDNVRLSVALVELPALNNFEVTAYDLVYFIIAALHWQPKAEGTALGAILAHPLQFQRTEEDGGMLSDPLLKGQFARVVSVQFQATFGIQTT